MSERWLWGVLVLLVSVASASAQYAGWKQTGPVWILTTPEGADLPATCSEADFPLLVRLSRYNFDFTQAKPHGEDIRFSDGAGKPLPYEIEEWDAAKGTATLWVRIPLIKGNARQQITLHWGNPDASSESNAAAVFNESNGYLSVWHMNEPLKDAVGTLQSKDVGTTPVDGIVGPARHFSRGHGIFGGDKIPNYPSGSAPHSTEAWFRTEAVNSTIIGWGNEGGARGTKVRMQLRSPAHIHIDSDFSDVNGTTPIPMSQWVHVLYTYSQNDGGAIYINGRLDASAKLLLNIKSPSRFWIGGWYNIFEFNGDIDEVRISKVARSANWARLEFENQKPLQTLVGPLPRAGTELSVSPARITLDEGKRATVDAKAGGAQKVYWIVKRDGVDSVTAVDRYSYTIDAGRVVGDTSYALQFKAVYPDRVEIRDIPVTVKEAIPEPLVTLKAPERWNGRDTIEVVPQISNLAAMKAKGAGELHYVWSVSGGAVIKEIAPDRLLLTRSQYSGPIKVTAVVDNGGKATVASIPILVTEPASDPWVQRAPASDEKPQDNQFYARDDKNEGTLYYNGTLEQPADFVFLRLYADGKLLKNESQKPNADKRYGFAMKLKPGLIEYKVEFGTRTGAVETVVRTVNNIVCGDAYLIDGQSNALATDTREKSPLETSEWIRSYAGPTGRGDGAEWVRSHIGPDATAKKPRPNLWCNPVWKTEKGEGAELGWWGMELAKRLVASQKIPVFVINAAVGGTRIDQHQRNEADPEDLTTMYGRMLWRVRHAGLTHGIRAVIWHQGENDQGSDGPDGGYGWESYQRYFVEMSAGWKRDFPNVQHYYIFQIWPNSCSMGAGHGDMLREVQRELPRLYSHMGIMSTLGVKPPGGCHFPLIGWSEFARLIQPLIERDIYHTAPAGSITPPNLARAYHPGGAKDLIALEFDQPVAWKDSLATQFYPGGLEGKIESGSVSGNILTLKLKEGSDAKTITYLKEMHWNQDNILLGANGLAALTFCDVPVEPAGRP